MAVRFELRGFEELDARLRALPDKVERQVMRKSLRSAGNKIARRIRSATPLGPPRDGVVARRAVKVSVKSTNKVAEARISYRGKPSAYMKWRDQGNRRQPARPFFEAAISGYEAEALRELSQALDHAISKAGA